MTGAATPDDVTSGAARALTGDDGDLSPAATGALALMHAWHRSALPALTGALTAPEADVRSAAHLVLASRAGSARRGRARLLARLSLCRPFACHSLMQNAKRPEKAAAVALPQEQRNAMKKLMFVAVSAALGLAAGLAGLPVG